jgi:hypothetical protein
MLHLYKTPRLADTLELKDVVFLEEKQQASSKAAPEFERSFLTKSISSTTPSTAYTLNP